LSRDRLKVEERWAVFTVHGAKCYMCGDPTISFRDFHVDHVIPEDLGDKPARLAAVLELLGRPATFDLNSYANWLPACAGCNQTKSSTTWEPSGLAQLFLQRAADLAAKAEEAERRVVGNRKLQNALGIVTQGLAQQGKRDFAEQVLEQFEPIGMDWFQHLAPNADPAGVRLTPTLTLIAVRSEDGLLQAITMPNGVMAGGPSDPSDAMRCGTCGGSWFNGSRCALCGSSDD
jgi:hypothetical protein